MEAAFARLRWTPSYKGRISMQKITQPNKKHTDKRTILVRVVAGAIALLMIGSVLLAAIY